MSPLEAMTKSSAGLATSGWFDGERVGVRLYGEANLEDSDLLGSLLDMLHREASERKSKEAVVDMRELSFMTSTCFRLFVTWFHRIKSLDEASRYRVTLVSSPQHHWQRRSLHALQLFAADIVSIEG